MRAWIKETPKVVIPPFIIYLLSGLIGIALLSLFVIWLLRREIRIATDNLRQTNEKLKESEKKFRDLFEKHTAVKLIIEPESGRIVEANEAAEKFYGWPKEKLLNMRIQDINMLSPEQVEAEMGKACQKMQSCFEFKHRTADGSFRDIETFSGPIEINGKELSKQLSSIHPNMMTLFMSGYTANIISRTEIIREGMIFLGKPFHINMFAVKIKKALMKKTENIPSFPST